MFTSSDITHATWLFSGGAILVLLQSIVSENKRKWHALLIGCVFGGVGATVAGHIFAENPWVYAICGCAAVVAENVLTGAFNMSKQFADSPLKVATHIFRTVAPFFGKSSGETSTPLNTDDLK